MKQHKWHKEIKAWADGAEIESRYIGRDTDLIQFKEWSNEEGCDCAWENKEWEFRIKPQLKEPQYLYVYYDADKTDFEFWDKTLDEPIGNKDYIGKIKLEVEDKWQNS